jgi:hypothetical protein
MTHATLLGCWPPGRRKRATGREEANVSIAEPNLDWLIPVDDHVLEPPTLRPDRVPAKHREV